MLAAYSPRAAAPPPRPQRPVAARMADFLIAREAASGGITRDDLLVQFTGAEIDTHLESAKAIARKAQRA